MGVQSEENSNETPLHTLQRVAGNNTIAEIVGRYWARITYLDINRSQQAQQVFLAPRGSINYANTDSSGSSGSYTVNSGRALMEKMLEGVLFTHEIRHLVFEALTKG